MHNPTRPPLSPVVEQEFNRIIGTDRVKALREELRERQSRNFTQINFAITIGVFTASVGAAPLSYANDRVPVSSNSTEPIACPLNSTEVQSIRFIQLSVLLSLLYVFVLCTFKISAMIRLVPYTDQGEAGDEVSRCKYLIRAIDKESELYGIERQLFKKLGMPCLMTPVGIMIFGLALLMRKQ